jgi:hypothetical protein
VILGEEVGKEKGKDAKTLANQGFWVIIKTAGSPRVLAVN